jgi:hypothetical protein
VKTPKFLIILAAVIIGALVSTANASTFLYLDFTQTGGPYPAGWDQVYGNFLSDTPTASINNIDGLGYNFSFNHVAVYDNGVATEPLTRSGFYTFGNDANDHTFTLGGLSAGSTVTLYASAAWNGNGRGGYVVFGDTGPNGVQAQTIGDPGISPVLGNLTMIGSATAGVSGILQGTLNGAGGVGSASEGQVGGFIFAIQLVPEPATFALAGLGIAACLVFRRAR